MEERRTGLNETIAPEKRQVLAFAGYPEFEAAADRTAVKIKEGFLEMGCILKMARDTDILSASGYRTVEEFADRRYGLDKGTVSRYIRIVERFSVDGESNQLKDSYKNMGFAKLSLMLHMPDAVAEELMDSLSKAEVAQIKEEIDAEGAVSDIELAIERASLPEALADPAEESLLAAAVRRLGEEQPTLYRKMWEAAETGERIRMLEALAPQEGQIYMVRIPGTGRVMLSLSGDSASVTSIRTGEKERYRATDVLEEWEKICPLEEGYLAAGARRGKLTAEEAYLAVYGAELPRETVQTLKPPQTLVATEKTERPQQKPQKEKRKPSRVTKARPAVPKAHLAEESPAAAVPEPQIPGQMEVSDYEGVVPAEENREIPEARFEEITQEESGEEESGEKAEAAVPAAGEDREEEGREAAEEKSLPAAGEEPGEDLPEQDAGAGAFEGTGGAEDPWGLSGRTEERFWREGREALYDVWKLWLSDTDVMQELSVQRIKKMYRRAIDTAAALEAILILRGEGTEEGGKNGKEHSA